MATSRMKGRVDTYRIHEMMAAGMTAWQFRSTGDPARAVRHEPSAWRDTVHMRAMRQHLPPGMQHGERNHCLTASTGSAFSEPGYDVGGRVRNLIALPLQGLARTSGNGMFFDESRSPYLDQWTSLSAIESMA